MRPTASDTTVGELPAQGDSIHGPPVRVVGVSFTTNPDPALRLALPGPRQPPVERFQHDDPHILWNARVSTRLSLRTRTPTSRALPSRSSRTSRSGTARGVGVRCRPCPSSRQGRGSPHAGRSSICGRCGSDEAFEAIDAATGHGWGISSAGDWPIPVEEIDERRARHYQQMKPAILTGDGHLITEDGSAPVINPCNTGGWAQYGTAEED